MQEPEWTQLKSLLAGKGEMDLDRAALTLATIEFPALEIENTLRTLDTFASEAALRSPGTSGRDFIHGLNRFLFQEIGIRGNEDDYYDPLNSCLNQVISRRLGIPITLSVLYMEICRRLGKTIYGIGLPSHFVVRYDDGEYATYIDPFHGGELLTADQCYDRARMPIGDPRVLVPVDNRQILFRMVTNLRGIYFQRRSFAKALRVMNLLIEITPQLPELYKHRAQVHVQMQQMKLARLDLETYLKLAPEAADREEIERQWKGVIRWLASLN